MAQAILNGEKIGAETCRTLRAGIDLARWFETPPIQIASSSPRIATINGFVAPAVCDWIVARARPMLAPAKVYDPGTGGYRQESVRDNSECHFLRKNSDLVLLALRARIAKAVELPVGAMDAPAVLHYTPGQRFLPHFDFLDTSHPGHAKQVAESGQRVLTLLLYLNDDYEGGETSFPALKWRYKGRKGDALLFWNVDTAGQPDRRTLHAGTAPTRGEKRALLGRQFTRHDAEGYVAAKNRAALAGEPLGQRPRQAGDPGNGGDADHDRPADDLLRLPDARRTVDHRLGAARADVPRAV